MPVWDICLTVRKKNCISLLSTNINLCWNISTQFNLRKPNILAPGTQCRVKERNNHSLLPQNVSYWNHWLQWVKFITEVWWNSKNAAGSSTIQSPIFPATQLRVRECQQAEELFNKLEQRKKKSPWWSWLYTPCWLCQCWGHSRVQMDPQMLLPCWDWGHYVCTKRHKKNDHSHNESFSREMIDFPTWSENGLRAGSNTALAFMVVRRWHCGEGFHTGWGLCGLNFSLVQKRTKPRPSYQLAQMWDRKGRGSAGAWKLSANIKTRDTVCIAKFPQGKYLNG